MNNLKEFGIKDDCYYVKTEDNNGVLQSSPKEFKTYNRSEYISYIAKVILEGMKND